MLVGGLLARLAVWFLWVLPVRLVIMLFDDCGFVIYKFVLLLCSDLV